MLRDEELVALQEAGTSPDITPVRSVHSASRLWPRYYSVPRTYVCLSCNARARRGGLLVCGRRTGVCAAALRRASGGTVELGDVVDHTHRHARTRMVVQLEVELGDVVVIDTRILHTGSTLLSGVPCSTLEYPTVLCIAWELAPFGSMFVPSLAVFVPLLAVFVPLLAVFVPLLAVFVPLFCRHTQ